MSSIYPEIKLKTTFSGVFEGYVAGKTYFLDRFDCSTVRNMIQQLQIFIVHKKLSAIFTIGKSALSIGIQRIYGVSNSVHQDL